MGSQFHIAGLLVAMHGGSREGCSRAHVQAGTAVVRHCQRTRATQGAKGGHLIVRLLLEFPQHVPREIYTMERKWGVQPEDVRSQIAAMTDGEGSCACWSSWTFWRTERTTAMAVLVTDAVVALSS
jgi:hypothetical protein